MAIQTFVKANAAWPIYFWSMLLQIERFAAGMFCLLRFIDTIVFEIAKHVNSFPAHVNSLVKHVNLFPAHVNFKVKHVNLFPAHVNLLVKQVNLFPVHVNSLVKHVYIQGRYAVVIKKQIIHP